MAYTGFEPQKQMQYKITGTLVLGVSHEEYIKYSINTNNIKYGIFNF